MKVTVQTHDVHVSNPGKVLFPNGITKTHVLGYYLKVAPRMLAHARDRALSLVRHPDGVTAEGFFQKTPGAHFPDWLPQATLPKKSRPTESRTYTTVEDAAGIAYLAGQATIEFHGWLSRASAPYRPDRLVIDLDPAEGDPLEAWGPVRAAARDTLRILERIDAPAYLLATGSKGLHVTVPLAADADFATSRALADRVARAMERDEPRAYTRSLRKENRGGRLFLDTLRNVYGATAVLPWSLRARPRASVATPVDHDFLDRSDARSDRYTLHDVITLSEAADPWSGLDDHRSSAGALLRRADEAGL